MIEPTSMQQHAIERLRDTYDTLACAPYLPIGTRTWIVAAFGRGIRKEWVELKRWRILPNGDVYDVLPDTPSADQPIEPPPDESLAGELPQLTSDELAEASRTFMLVAEILEGQAAGDFDTLRGNSDEDLLAALEELAPNLHAVAARVGHRVPA